MSFYLKNLLIFSLIALLTSCVAHDGNLNSTKITRLDGKLNIQQDRIMALEDQLKDINQRLEKAEFLYLQKKNQMQQSASQNQYGIGNSQQAYSQNLQGGNQGVQNSYEGFRQNSNNQGQNFNNKSVGRLSPQGVNGINRGGTPAVKNSNGSLSANNSLNTQSSLLNKTSAIVPLNLLKIDKRLVERTFQRGSGTYIDLLQGFNHLEQNQFTNALSLFEQLSNASLNRQWQAKNVFWQAVVLEAMKEDKRAIALYGKLLSQFSDSNRTSIALFRQASLFFRIGESELAQLSYQKLVAEYPASKEAEIARDRLKEFN